MYNILPPTTATTGYTIALRKLSYFCLQFFVGIQKVVSEYLYIYRSISGTVKLLPHEETRHTQTLHYTCRNIADTIEPLPREETRPTITLLPYTHSSEAV